MKNYILFLLLFLCTNNVYTQENAPEIFLIGNFTDDYGSNYNITKSLWTQLPKANYHIIKWNKEEQYLIAKNDTANKTDKGLYTRIDYLFFENMPPYTWGFCLTTYDAANPKAAENTIPVDRKNPRKGCNSYPFSRMKKTE